MQYILMLYARESGWSELTQAQQEQAMGGNRGAEKRRRANEREPPPTDFDWST
jgi:hypothetical protein